VENGARRQRAIFVMRARSIKSNAPLILLSRRASRFALGQRGGPRSRESCSLGGRRSPDLLIAVIDLRARRASSSEPVSALACHSAIVGELRAHCTRRRDDLVARLFAPDERSGADAAPFVGRSNDTRS
jgi:hypothetical protein